MRKIYMLSVLLCALCLGKAQSQTASLSIADYIEAPGQVVIPMEVSNLNNIAAITINLYYNADVLTYVNYQNPLAVFIVNDASVDDTTNSLNITFFAGGLTGQNFNGNLLEMIFEYQGGYSEFNFYYVEIVDNFYNEVPVNISNGSISFQTPAPVDMGTLDNLTPGAVVVPLNVDFSAVDNGVGAFNFNITYDPAVLENPTIANEALDDIYLDATIPGEINLQWENPDPLAPAGSLLNGKLLDLQFNFLGGSSDISFVEENSSISNQNGVNWLVEFSNGSVFEISYTVVFNIKDGQGGDVTNASITLGEQQNPPGNYVFTDVLAGSYAYMVTAPGFTEDTGELIVADEDVVLQIVINDIEAPVIECPADMLDVHVDEGACFATITDLGTPFVSDNHTPVDDLLISNNAPVNQQYPVGETIVTWMAQDAAGNSNTCIQTILVIDDIVPHIDCPTSPQLRIIEAAASSYTTIEDEFDPVSLSDNCGILTVSNNLNESETLAGYDFFPGNTNVIWTVLDTSGNSNSCSFIVEIVYENRPPTIDCPGNIVAVTDAGVCTALVEGLSAVYSDPDDNIIAVTWAMTGATAASSADTGINNLTTYVFNQGVTSITYTVTDAGGLFDTCTFTVTVNDTEAPTITCPPNMLQLTTDAGACFATIADLGMPVVADNCTSVTELIIVNDAPANNQFPVGTTLVTWTVSDSAGNFATCEQTFTVADDEPPVISNMPDDITAGNDPGQCGAVVTWTIPTADDNCNVASFESTHQPGDFFPLGETTVTYTAVDAAGNETTEGFTVTVEDTEAPIISGMPGDITAGNDPGQCGAVVTWTIPTADDNCGVASFEGTHQPGDLFPLGETTVTYTAVDAAGNETTEGFTVTVEDTEAPVISGMPDDITAGNDPGQCGAVVTWTLPTADDNCGVASFESTHQPGDLFPLGETTVTYTAVDTAGNETTEGFTVTVEDTEAPVISGMPDNIFMENEAGQCGAFATWTEPTAADNCGVTTIESTYQPGSFFLVGETTVAYTAVDAAGNETTASFTVTVEDTEAPIISVMPNDITAGNDPGQCGAVVTWTIPTASDNCSVTSLQSTHQPGEFFPLGETTVTYTAADAAGNETTASFAVTVEDTEAPVISGMPNDITAGNDPGQCGAVVTWTVPTADDNCGVASFESTHQPGDLFPLGETTVTYTAIDAAGNETTEGFTVTVEDTEAPVISDMPDDITVVNDLEQCGAMVTWTPPTAEDNCSLVSFNGSHQPGEFFHVGETTVTYTAVDAAGNQTILTFSITVDDVEAPIITGMPNNVSTDNEPGQCGATIEWVAPSATDNCSVVSFVSTHQSGVFLPVGITTVIYTAVDAAGNETSESFTVTINDTMAPVISGVPGNITKENDEGMCGAIATWNEPIADDNCNVVSLNGSHQPGEFFQVGETTVTYTAVDAAGNETTIVFTVTVEDTEAPVITGMPGNITVTAEQGESGAVVSWIEPNAEDNCAVVSFFSSHVPGDFFPAGVTEVIYTAVDAAGNQSTAGFTVTVEDTESPVPPIETLQGIIVPDGEVVCFNATQTIITAGNNTYFIVEGGGSATLIAGQSIRMLPGTLVEHGGYLHARITLDQEYCGAPVAKLLDEPADLPLAGQILPDAPGKETLFKVYPNPTSGAFTLELNDGFVDAKVTVEVYGLRGERIISEDLPSMHQHVFTLENQLPGIYIVRVTAGERTDQLRIMKR